MKKSGILLHFTSLSTDFGIGDLGPAAYRFADYLVESGHKIWQILPLNQPGYGDSPYNPISAFAMNEYLISPELLVQDALLKQEELITLPQGKKIDYPAVYAAKNAMHKAAAERYLARHDINDFIAKHAEQIKPYLSFVWLSHRYGNSAWYTWDTIHKSYSESLYESCADSSEVLRAAALQAIFTEQMLRLKEYLNKRGIALFGDMPLYLSYESAEVWAHQKFFDLDEQGRRLSVAGVPPDAYAPGGQLWGNPTYNWNCLQEEDFNLFLDRIANAFQFMDILRLDHFIGYVNFWKVLCPDAALPDSAEGGSWVKALPRDFFAALKAKFSIDRFVAEDLGILNNEVCEIRDELGFPGMIVLQFCFEESVPDVAQYPEDRLIYSGTHDNNTTRGWWQELPPDSSSRRHMTQYCSQHLDGISPSANNIAEIMQRIARHSACEIMIFPLQDILGLGSEARMNIPGTAQGNWQWRLTDTHFFSE
jgi:4-alpha-glucanotransferase